MEKDRKNINWEKIGIYIAVLTGFLMVITKLMDVSERIAKLEVKTEFLLEAKK